MKNKSTNLFRYFCANAPQNAGGGNSQSQRYESVHSTLAGRRLSNTLITHESPTNHPLKQSVWKVAAMLLMVLTLGVGNAWGANGDVLFNQEFGTGSLNFAESTERAYTTSATLTGLVGSGTNLFSSATCGSGSTFGIGYNSVTGGNSANWTGKFGAYGNSNGGSRYWSLVKKGIAATAPTAIIISFKATYSPNGSTGSNPGVQFAVGSGFNDGITTTLPALDKCFAGFSIPQQT